MEKHIRAKKIGHEPRSPRLGELIHDWVRAAIEQAVEEELQAALGAVVYERTGERRGYRNGTRERGLTGPTGPLKLSIPRATLFGRAGSSEWRSSLIPRYQRRVAEVNETIAAAYLTGANTRRIRGALSPLLKGAPLSKSAVSRVVGTLKTNFDAWRKRPLKGLDAAYLYLDAIALKIRSAGKVVSMPVLAAVAVLSDGTKQLISLETCASESQQAWKGFLDDLVTRGLKAPLLCIIDGNPGLRSALSTVWSKVPVQRCAVHKLRNLERKAPKHAIDELKEDYHRIVYAENLRAATAAYAAFIMKWKKQCPGVVRSLEEGGEELLTFFRFPKSQWKTIRTTNVIERLNEEFRRRVKTQCSMCTEDAALVLLFSLVATGQIKLRKLDGYNRLGKVIRDKMGRAA